jgi:hypothetical protein
MTVDQGRVNQLMENLKLSYHDAYMRVKKSTLVQASNSAETVDGINLQEVEALMREFGITYRQAITRLKKARGISAVNSASDLREASAVSVVARQNGNSRLLQAVNRTGRTNVYI